MTKNSASSLQAQQTPMATLTFIYQKTILRDISMLKAYIDGDEVNYTS